MFLVDFLVPPALFKGGAGNVRLGSVRKLYALNRCSPGNIGVGLFLPRRISALIFRILSESGGELPRVHRLQIAVRPSLNFHGVSPHAPNSPSPTVGAPFFPPKVSAFRGSFEWLQNTKPLRHSFRPTTNPPVAIICTRLHCLLL